MDHEKNRSEPRKKVLIPVMISDRNRAAQMPGEISDASQSGCRITNCAVDELSSDILIKVATIEKPIKGRIMWRRGGSAGVKFVFDNKKPDERPSKDLTTSEPAVTTPKPAKSADSAFEASVRNREQDVKYKCTVKNPNGTGCLLIAENTAVLPDAITVQFGDLKKPLNGTITWRSTIMAGVAFDFSPEADKFFL